MLLEKMRSAVEMRKVEDRGDAIANAIIGIALTLIMLAIGFVLFSNILPGQQLKADTAEVKSVVQSVETLRATDPGADLPDGPFTELGGPVNFPEGVTFGAVGANDITVDNFTASKGGCVATVEDGDPADFAGCAE